MKKYKHISLFIVLIFLCLSFSACQKKEEPAVPLIEGYPTIHETEFGGVYIKIPIDEFNGLGFEFGDSVDVEFSSGYKLEDIPYYNGYYVDPGQILLIGYPGYDYIKAAINYGEDLWDKAELQMNMGGRPTLYQQVRLDEHSTASIRLREKGKYRDIQEARDISYTDLREDYPSDVAFANFRNIVMGEIGEGKVYRSASPCDNQHKRAPYVDALIKEASVNYILDLADNDVKIGKYLQAEDFVSEYFRTLYEEDRVYPLALSMNYMGEDFAVKVADGFIAMSKAEGPYLIHCTEGKDRTGFVCMLLEALAKADYQQIADDYMLTYDNYYKINEVKDPARYRVILEKNLDAMIRYVVGDESVDFRNCDLSVYARAYLLKAGMEEEQIDTLLEKIR